MNCLVITGASAGIGLATARRFLAAGFRVVNISRRPCPAQGVVQLTADLGDPASVTAIRASLDAAQDRLGGARLDEVRANVELAFGDIDGGGILNVGTKRAQA